MSAGAKEFRYFLGFPKELKILVLKISSVYDNLKEIGGSYGRN